MKFNYSFPRRYVLHKQTYQNIQFHSRKFLLKKIPEIRLKLFILRLENKKLFFSQNLYP